MSPRSGTGLAAPAGPSASACPSVERVLARVDGGLVRIRVPGGALDASGLDALVEVAGRWGNGVVEITNRANLQLRGVDPAYADRVAGALVAAGLSGGPAADRRRNILVDPLGDLDPTAVDFRALLPAVLDALDGEPRLDALDEKFGLAIDGGGRWGLAGRRAAVVVVPAAGRPAGVIELSWGWAAPGSLGSPARPLAAPIAELPAALVSVAVDSLGRRRASLTVPSRPAAGSPALSAGACRPEEASGPLGAGDGWVGVMPVLGRLDVAALTAVADAARRYAGGALRLTPWRGVVLTGVGQGERSALLEEWAGAGLVVDRADAAATVVACAGSAGCTSGLTDAMGDARRIVAGLRRAGVSGTGVHVSGCAKRCAQATPAPVTLIGVARGRYDVYVGDRLRAEGSTATRAIAMVQGVAEER